VDPATPETIVRIPIDKREPVREFDVAIENYTELGGKFDFGTYLWNSVFITVVATLITLLFNSMAAFALSKYRFTGSRVVFLLILSTLMVPPTIVLVPNFLVVSELGLLNSLWGVIWPAVATPTGVFLLRQYMLTLPDELLEAARMDHASEWRIYWRIVLPLSKAVVAVVGLFYAVGYWNAWFTALLYIDDNEKFPIQRVLQSFILAGQSPQTSGTAVSASLPPTLAIKMAVVVVTVAPIAMVYPFIQRHFAKGTMIGAVKG
jgi:alpha-1,4-digalacturonate transport system permease protein